jgi:hypothetical protein
MITFTNSRSARLVRHSIVLLLALMSCIQIKLNAQVYTGESLLLSTQQQVDEFNYEAVNGILTIRGQDITNIDGLRSLKSVGSNLDIRENPLLSDISGLSGLESVQGAFTLTNNPSLSACCVVESIKSLVQQGVTVSGNASNCSSKDEITAACTQQVCTGDVLLSTQAQVDAFNCSQIIGNLIINDNGADAGDFISDLSNLSSLTLIEGNLTIEQCPLLKNLQGLDNLQTVKGNFVIYNTDLEYLAGLNNLTSVGGNFNIGLNFSLKNLQGLQNLQSIDGNFNVTANNLIPNFAGLDHLVHINGDFQVENNNGLLNFEGLPYLASVGQNFTIGGNQVLSNLAGLTSLTTVSGILFIAANTTLSTLDGLQNLTSVNTLAVRDNATLNSLMAFEKLTTIHRQIQIISNPQLANLQGLDLIQRVSFVLEIINNDGLTSLDGLGELQTTDQLFIQNNSTLASLSGLGKLTSVNTLTITDNPLLSDCCILEPILAAATGVKTIGNNKTDGNCNSIASLSACRLLICTGDVILTTQAQVDAFNCSQVTGNLRVETAPDAEDPITNLDKLQVLESVGGYLFIGNNPQLQQLGSFVSLQTVGDFLAIVFNEELTAVDGFANLVSVGGYVQVYINNKLSSVQGFSNVTSIGGQLNIEANPALGTLDGFADLQTLGGNFRIWDNQALAGISGLGSVTSITGSFNITGSPGLNTLSGFNNLQTVGGFFQIANLGLESLPGFANLETVAGLMNFYGNARMTQLSPFPRLKAIGGFLDFDNFALLGAVSGFDALEHVGGYLRFINNPLLSRVSGFSKLVWIGDNLAVNNNALLNTFSGFNSVESIGNDLRILNNASLTTMGALANLKTVNGSLSIQNNLSLSDCCVFQPVISVTKGSVTIENNQAGCNSQADIIQTCAPPVVIEPEGTTTFCASGSVMLKVKSPVAGYSYQWSNGQAGTSIPVTTSGTYFVKATIAPSIEITSNSIQVQVIALPLPTISANGTTSLYEGQTVTLSVNNPDGSLQYQWFRDGIAFETGTQIKVKQAGRYTVQATFVIVNQLICPGPVSTPILVTISPLNIVRFELVDGTTQTVLLTLTEGIKIDLNSPLLKKVNQLNVSAITNPAKTGSVSMVLSGASDFKQVDNKAPYYLFGTAKGEATGSLGLGQYRLTATPYIQAGASGISGTPLSLRFSIVNSKAREGYETASNEAAGHNIEAYPNPVSTRLTIHLGDYRASSIKATSVSVVAGKQHLMNSYRITGENALEIEVQALKPGFYLLRLQGDSFCKYIKMIKQ